MAPTGPCWRCGRFRASPTSLRSRAPRRARGWRRVLGSLGFVPGVTAYTSGAATATLLAAIGLLDDRLLGEVSSIAATITAALSTAANLTITAPGAGLRHYITGLRIERHAAGLLTAGTTPVVVTTTNLPGALAFSIPMEAAAQGSVYEKSMEPARAIMASAQNTTTTIVAPLTTSVIWRISATFYVAP